MRTTLVIDDDVLVTARAIARQKKRPLGEIISDLARRSLHERQSFDKRSGIPLLPRRDGAAPVTLAMVNELRDGPL
ncbi:MAG: CopG family transcriptional regulator [Rhizobiaceae bacterium]|jgi:hypothetical protein